MINNNLKIEFLNAIALKPLQKIAEKKQEQLPVDYFAFYNSISSVYSSKIEGENIDFDSFFKHKFLKVKYKPDYTKKAEDLFKAYEFIQQNEMSPKNIFKAHKMLGKHLFPKKHKWSIRETPIFVINGKNRIEYIACEPYQVKEELDIFFVKISELLDANLSILESFFYAAQIHLVFVKIHPMQDGNGRTARLLEKWFLLQKLGEDAVSIELEKNYYINRAAYYNNIRKIGLEYQTLDYSKALDFLLMTVNSLK